MPKSAILGDMRRFEVAGGLLRLDDALLLVCNKRRDGRIDWSPPGGIVDDGESTLEGLTREVAEETKLEVVRWGAQRYEVVVDFEHLNWQLTARVFEAESWSGDLHVDDPDGVVVDAAFIDLAKCDDQLARSPRWVAEPMMQWIGNQDTNAHATFAYRADKADGRLQVERTDL